MAKEKDHQEKDDDGSHSCNNNSNDDSNSHIFEEESSDDVWETPVDITRMPKLKKDDTEKEEEKI